MQHSFEKHLFITLLVFLGCLVYVVAYRFFQNEKELLTITHELETARQIQSFILPQQTVGIKGIYLAAHYVPMASVAGDFYDFIKVDENRMGILVADVCGHGVPASLIGSMVKIAYHPNYRMRITRPRSFAALIKYCAVNWKVILSPPVIYSLIWIN